MVVVVVHLSPYWACPPSGVGRHRGRERVSQDAAGREPAVASVSADELHPGVYLALPPLQVWRMRVGVMGRVRVMVQEHGAETLLWGLQ